MQHALDASSQGGGLEDLEPLVTEFDRKDADSKLATRGMRVATLPTDGLESFSW